MSDDRSDHEKQEEARLAADRLRERESARAQLRVREAAGDTVTDDEKKKVDDQIAELKRLAEGPSA